LIIITIFSHFENPHPCFYLTIATNEPLKNRTGLDAVTSLALTGLALVDQALAARGHDAQEAFDEVGVYRYQLFQVHQVWVLNVYPS
jgi:hypothetical protein